MSLLNKTQLKTAAIYYCKAFGLDPEEKVQYPDPDGHAVARYTKRWCLVARRIKELDVIDEASREARSGQT